MIVDRHGTPLAVSLTGGNRHDVTQLIPLLDAIPRIRGRRGRPRHTPKRLYADRGYDFRKYRRLLWARGIVPKIARRGAPHGSGLGKTRWVVERTFAWLHQFERLRICYGIRADLHQAPPTRLRHHLLEAATHRILKRSVSGALRSVRGHPVAHGSQLLCGGGHSGLDGGDLAKPALVLGFLQAVDEVSADLLKAWHLGWVHEE